MYLEVSQLQVQYANRPTPAVAGVTFGLRAGDIGVLIGPSGCGKTTLLRAVAGLERATAGEIKLAKSVVSNVDTYVPAESRRIGMVFQDYALFPHLDVAKNIAFGIAHLPKTERLARVAEVLDLVGLPDTQHRYPHELSGGQQQRVALARALAPKPQLLLLDEPFSNLDVDLRERLAHELRVILKNAHATALFVTHDQLEAFAIGDVIGVMHEGLLHQWDDAYTLYHRPATRFVADFIGHGVFLPAKICDRTTEVCPVPCPETDPNCATSCPFNSPANNSANSRNTSQTLVHTPLGDLGGLDECPLPTAYPNGECDLLLRADVKAQIVRKAFRGSEFLYTLRLKTGETVLAHVPSHHDHSLGEWIGIRAEVDHVVTFEREVQRAS